MRSGAGMAVVLSALAAVGLVLVFALGGEGEADRESGLSRAPGEDGAEAAIGADGVRLESRFDGLVRHPAAAEGASDAKPAAPTFPPSEGIGGRVLDGRGNPIFEATVKLIPLPAEDLWRWGMPDREPIATTTSAKDGSFLVGPAPEGRLKIRAEAAGFAPTVQQVARRGTRVDLILDLGGTLAIKVRDMANKPVEGAQVAHQAGSVVTTGMTSPEGTVTFTSLPTGTGSLLVTHQAFAALRQGEVAVAPGKTLDVTLVMAKGMELRGTVVRASDERPVAGAQVEVRYPNIPSAAPSATTASGDDGIFHVTLAAGVNEQIEVRVRHEEFAEARVNQNVNDPGSGAMQMTVKLSPAGEAFRGRVVGSDRAPVAGAVVTYGYMPSGNDAPEAKTDASGNFELPLPTWGSAGSNWFLIAVAPNEGVGALNTQAPKPGEGRKVLEIVLSGAGKVEGKVADGAGKPVAGALVTLAPDWNFQNGGGRGRPVDWMVLQAVQDPKRYNLAAISGDDGAYLIEGVPVANYRATAQLGLDQGTLPESIVVGSGGSARADIVLGAGATIEGWVTDTQGEPVPGAYVNAQPEDQRGYGTWPYARAQSDGKFVMRGVGDSAYMVYAGASGFGGANQQHVRAGTKDLALKLTALGWIEGVVTMDAEPLRGTFTVAAKRTSGGDEGGSGIRNIRMRGNMMGGDEEHSQTFSTDDGRFSLRGLSAGDYAVSVSTAEGFIATDPQQARVMDGRATTGVILTLTRGAIVTGVVISERDGRPIANAYVNVNPRPGSTGAATSAGAQTDAEGRFAIRGLATGQYLAWVYSPAGLNWSEPLDLTAGQEHQVRLTERVPGRIRILVQDAQGSLIAGASPMVTSDSGAQVYPNWQAMTRDGLFDRSSGDPWQRAMNTDASGVNVRYHVPPGRYRVSATMKGYAAPTEPPWVEVVGNGTTEVTVVLTTQADVPPNAPPPPALR